MILAGRGDFRIQQLSSRSSRCYSQISREIVNPRHTVCKGGDIACSAIFRREKKNPSKRGAQRGNNGELTWRARLLRTNNADIRCPLCSQHGPQQCSVAVDEKDSAKRYRNCWPRHATPRPAPPTVFFVTKTTPTNNGLFSFYF